MQSTAQLNSIFYPFISDQINLENGVTFAQAEQIFSYFKTHPLFRWDDAHNNCEARANAICILLNEWNVANCKGWVFSGLAAGKGIGTLHNNWAFHVAAMVPVGTESELVFLVIDPSVCSEPTPLEIWASKITHLPYSFYCIKKGDYYIFPLNKLTKNWYKTNQQNIKWTMQGLAGINGISQLGKAKLVYQKKRIAKIIATFEHLKKDKPNFI